MNYVYFVNGVTFAGKSTIVKMISDKLGLYFCGKNYNLDQVLTKVTPKEYHNFNVEISSGQLAGVPIVQAFIET